jgi:predicted Zn-dependent protease
VDSVKIIICDDVLNYGFNNAIIGQIAKHEVGHALGLGHPHDEERLMSDIVIAYKTENISDCEIKGVLPANEWKLVRVYHMLSAKQISNMSLITYTVVAVVIILLREH